MFSFVLPAYKADFLAQAITSILCQSLQDFEIVIVNDSSPYDLDSIVGRFEDSRISYYINKENIGSKNLVKQWNNCLKYAKGEYVILSSDDDIYSPDYLLEMSQMICLYPNCNVYGCRKRIINSSGAMIDVDGYMGENMSFYEFSDRLYSGVIYSSISNYLFRKSALICNGGFVDFPLAWYSDDATILRLAHNGIAFSNKLLFSFRFSDTNISSITSPDIIRRKLEATTLFFDWMNKEYLHIVPETEVDKIYVKRKTTQLKSYISRKTRYLAMGSNWLGMALIMIDKQLKCSVSVNERMKILLSKILN